MVILLFLHLATPGYSQVGFISFAQEQIIVEEGPALFTPAQIPLIRNGGTSGVIVVSISVSNHR